MQLVNAVFKELYKTIPLWDVCPTANCLFIMPNPHHEMTLFRMDEEQPLMFFISNRILGKQNQLEQVLIFLKLQSSDFSCVNVNKNLRLLVMFCSIVWFFAAIFLKQKAIFFSDGSGLVFFQTTSDHLL